MKNWIASIVVALAGLASGQAAGEPNIVLIMADDMGYECVTANGGESYSTPNLDRLARGGMRFEHCYSQPICTPSRVQLMTGNYNQRNYIRFGLLDPAVTTFGHLAKRAGYATCIGGKWQLENGLKGPNHFGFDEYCLWQLTRRPSRYPNPGLEVNSTLRYKLHRDGRFIDIANDPLEVKPLDTGRLGNAQRKTLAMLQNVLDEKEGTRTRFGLKKYKTKK
jgi:arylsulfatase A|tara:strand:- start:865 stop:1527 length:663 start_codon:yes stop_codon:yes gene_type:complete